MQENKDLNDKSSFIPQNFFSFRPHTSHNPHTACKSFGSYHTNDRNGMAFSQSFKLISNFLSMLVVGPTPKVLIYFFVTTNSRSHLGPDQALTPTKKKKELSSRFVIHTDKIMGGRFLIDTVLSYWALKSVQGFLSTQVEMIIWSFHLQILEHWIFKSGTALYMKVKHFAKED